MEPRASHLAVGGLVLLLFCSIPVLLIWSSKSTKENLVEHYVHFRDSVAGLEVGSNVLFGGIPVGHVTAVRIDPQHSSLARVDIAVDGAAPIYSDSKATMKLQGISGKILIDISRGGGTRSRRLEPGEEIAARYSPFGKLMLSLQEIPAKGDLLIERASAFFDARNIALADQILANVDKLRAHFAGESPVLSDLGPGISDAVARFRQAWAEIQQDSGNIDRLKATVAAADQAIQNLTVTFSKTAMKLGGLVEDSRRPIDDFANNGFSQWSPMVSELHRLGRSLERLWAEVRQDPARFFLTDRQEGGFEPPPPSMNQRH